MGYFNKRRIFIGLLFIFFIGLINVLVYEYSEILMSIVIFGVLGLIILSMMLNKQRKNAAFLIKVFLCAFVIRIILVFVLSGLMVSLRGEPFLGGGDDLRDDIYGQGVCESLRAGYGLSNYLLGREVSFTTSQVGLPILNGVLYYLFGHNIFVPRILNALMGALLAVLMFKIAAKIYKSVKIAKLAAWLGAFYPNLVYYSSVQLKDIVTALLGAIIIWNVIKLDKIRDCYRIIYILLAFIIFSYFRRQLIVVYALVVVFYLCFLKFRKSRLTGLILGLFLLLIVGWGLTVTGIGFLGRNIIISIPQSVQQRTARVMSAASEAQRKTSLIRKQASYPLVVRAPISFVYSLITPFPFWKTVISWKYTGTVSELFATPGVLVWYILMPFAFLGIIYSRRKRIGGTQLMYLTAIIILLGISITQFGETYRYRLQIMPFLLIFASVGIVKYKEYKKEHKNRLWCNWLVLYVFVFIGGILAYLCMKF